MCKFQTSNFMFIIFSYVGVKEEFLNGSWRGGLMINGEKSNVVFFSTSWEGDNK